MIQKPFGYIGYNYGNIGHKVRDEPRGAFARGATKARKKQAQEINELGDMLSIVFPRSLEMSLHSTATHGSVIRVLSTKKIRDEHEMFKIITNMSGYKIVENMRNYLYLKKL